MKPHSLHSSPSSNSLKHETNICDNQNLVYVFTTQLKLCLLERLLLTCQIQFSSFQSLLRFVITSFLVESYPTSALEALPSRTSCTSLSICSQFPWRLLFLFLLFKYWFSPESIFNFSLFFFIYRLSSVTSNSVNSTVPMIQKSISSPNISPGPIFPVVCWIFPYLPCKHFELNTLKTELINSPIPYPSLLFVKFFPRKEEKEEVWVKWTN